MCVQFALPSLRRRCGRTGGRTWRWWGIALLLILAGGTPMRGTGPLYQMSPDTIESSVTQINSAKPDQIKGVLPKGWQEDSAWGDVEMEYTLEKGLPGQPKAYLRARIDKCTKGQAQIKLPFAAKPGQQFIKFTLRARSITGNNFQIMVRQQDAPYKAYWQQNVKLDTFWRDYDFQVEINAPDSKLAALLVLGKGGKTDIAQLTFSQQTKDEVIAALKKEFPDGGPRNVLSHSRLPSGLPSGWTYASASSLGDELVIAPDSMKEQAPELPKIEGVAPLRIATHYTIPAEGGPALERDAALNLCTEAVTLAAPYEPHTVSLYVSGKLDKGVLSVLADGQSIKDEWFTVKPEDGWKRITFSFTPKLLARRYVLKLDGSGEFWLDGWQINPGNKPLALEPASAGELTLTFGNQSRVVFAGEPVPLQVTVVNYQLPPDGATLVAERLNAYGKVRKLRDQVIKDQGVSRVMLQETGENDGEPANGPVMISAWLEVDGKRVSAKEELIYNVVPKPANWDRDAPGSFFGAHLPPTRRHIEMAKAIGIDWVRLQDDARQPTSWAAIEPEKGVWAYPDAVVDRYRAAHLLILGRLSTTPAWARVGDYRETSHSLDLYFRAKNPQDFANYTDRVVEHYQGRIAAWDVWRRPWDRLHTGYKKEKKDWSDRYVQDSDALNVYGQYSEFAAASLAKYDPAAVLVAINGNYRGKGERWLEEAVKMGLVESAEAIGFHAYWSVDRGNLVDPGSNFSALINRNILTPLLRTYPRIPRPLWMTEASFSLGPFEQGLQGWNREANGRNRVLLWTLADRAVRFCVAAQALGVEKVFLYSMDPAASASGEARASLVGEDAYLAPSGVALAVFAHETEGRKIIKRLEVSPGIFAVFYDGGPQSFTILVPAEGELLPALSQLKGARFRDIFGNPAEVAKGRVPDGSIYLESDLSPAQFETRLREILPPFGEKKP